MNRRIFRIICLFIFSFFITSCSSLDFVAGGRTPFKIAVGNKSDQPVEIESTSDFYLWGYSPGSATIDLEDQGNKFGLDLPSAVTISQSTSFKSFLYTVLTLGFYCPVNYKITMLTVKEQQ